MTNENKRLRAEVEYLERIVIPAMLRVNGTTVIPLNTLNTSAGARVAMAQNAAGDVILKLEGAECGL